MHELVAQEETAWLECFQKEKLLTLSDYILKGLDSVL
jgi:hypothetical protein